MIIYIVYTIVRFNIYFSLFFIFSAFLKLLSFFNIIKDHKIKIVKENKIRFFNILPLREMILIPPISFGLWFILSFFYKLNFIILFVENFIAMFLTGFGIHYIFGIKSKLGNKLKINKEPDGTGILPYARSQDIFEV